MNKNVLENRFGCVVASAKKVDFSPIYKLRGLKENPKALSLLTRSNVILHPLLLLLLPVPSVLFGLRLLVAVVGAVFVVVAPPSPPPSFCNFRKIL